MPSRSVDLQTFRRSVKGCPPGQLYLSDPWLLVEDECAELEPVYVVAERDSQTVGAACYGFHEGSNPWPFARPDLFLAQALDGAAPTSGQTLPAYCFGGRRPGHSEVAAAAPDDALLDQLVIAAGHEVRRRGAACLLAPYVADARLARGLERAGFIGFPSWSRWELDLPGSSFEDYLAWLPRGTRSNITTERRRIRADGLRGHVEPLDESHLPALVDLELLGYERFGHRYRRDEAEALHQAVLRHLRGQAFVSIVQSGDRLVGFAVLVRCDDALYGRQAAVDHDAVGRAPVYFEVVYYQALEFAYGQEIRLMDYSISSDQAKRLRGCREVPTRTYCLLFDEQVQAHLRAAVDRRFRAQPEA